MMKNSMAVASDSVKKAKTTIEILDQAIESKTLTRRAVEAIFERITVYENGIIDIKLKPYLQVLDPMSYTVDIKPRNQPSETYEVRTDRDETGLEEDDLVLKTNDTCDGSPSYASFAYAVKMLRNMSRLANYIGLHK